jgi:serine/threonine protein kinase
MANIENRIIGNYEFQHKIGSGSFASVYKATHLPTMLAVAIKVINKNLFHTNKRKTDFLNLIKMYRSLHHPFIAEFFDFFESNQSYNIVMEYLPNGSLYDFITKNKKFEENDAKVLFLQLIEVIKYLHHDINLVHRDLKSQNIMLDKYYNIRLIDFDLSRTFQSGNSMFYTKCGSLASVAPEIISGQPYNAKCDMWSSGIILYQMICGKLPFEGKNQNTLCRQIKFNEPNYDGISPDLTNLIKQLLKKNPDERITLSDIQSHSCFLYFDYCQLLNSTLEQVKTFYETILTKNDQNDNFLKEHILNKGQITDFLHCLNQIKFENVRSYQIFEKKTQMINQKKSQPNTRFRRRSDPTSCLFKERYPISFTNIKINLSKSSILKNRGMIIQQTINSAHHAPILDSATTGFSDK